MFQEKTSPVSGDDRKSGGGGGGRGSPDRPHRPRAWNSLGN